MTLIHDVGRICENLVIDALHDLSDLAETNCCGAVASLRGEAVASRLRLALRWMHHPLDGDIGSEVESPECGLVHVLFKGLSTHLRKAQRLHQHAQCSGWAGSSAESPAVTP